MSKLFFFFALIFLSLASRAQVADSTEMEEDLITTIPDVDDEYIVTFTRSNDVRIFYGGEGTSLAYGSSRNDSKELNTAVYKNASDLIGVGVSYKLVDGAVFFSLPKTQLMNDDRENLDQFRFALSYTGRRYSLRGFLMDYRGMVVDDVSGEFTSEADVKFFRAGAQLTIFLNEQKYSYRAANFQSELQRKTAGSFLFRVEPSYRKIQTATRLVPPTRDVPQVYGDQTGLHDVDGAGLLIMPGYGINVVGKNGKFFFSPYVFGGPGFALNKYEGDKGKLSSLNWEWAASAVMSIGYNGNKTYATFRASTELYYIPLQPSYFTSFYLKLGITVGYRFRAFEKLIPSSVF